MTQENLRAALIAASNLYPAAYPLKDWKVFTSAQATQFVFDRALEIAEWLDAQEAGEFSTARAVMANSAAARSNAPIIWESREQELAYVRWLDANRKRDSVSAQHEFLETLKVVRGPS